MQKLLNALKKRQDLALGLILGAAIGWIISTAPGWMRATSETDWWEIASAIGTVGAVIVAMALALRENRRQRIEKILRAQLVAVGIRARLIHATFALRRMLEAWEPDRAELEGADYRESCRVKLAALRDSISRGEIESFAIAPERMAFILIEALGEIEFVLIGLAMGPPNDQTVDTYRSALQHALAKLQHVLAECQAHVQWK